tara:strand:+ start:6285 stop:6635 length:351 start_codon:yes stop_codon:yes gene_type:complete
MIELEGKKVKVGYSIIEIKKQGSQFLKDNMSSTYAQYLSRESVIEIQPELPKLDEANAILHEIMHACSWVGSLSQNGQPLADTDNEEVVINTLTNHLIQVFMDNEWLLPYLTEKLK